MLGNFSATARQLRLIPGWSRYPDLREEPEHFIALDAIGTEVGAVIRAGVPTPDAGWEWTLRLRHPGSTFPEPISGSCATRDEAAQSLAQCYEHFRAHYD